MSHVRTDATVGWIPQEARNLAGLLLAGGGSEPGLFDQQLQQAHEAVVPPEARRLEPALPEPPSHSAEDPNDQDRPACAPVPGAQPGDAEPAERPSPPETQDPAGGCWSSESPANRQEDPQEDSAKASGGPGRPSDDSDVPNSDEQEPTGFLAGIPGEHGRAGGNPMRGKSHKPASGRPDRLEATAAPGQTDADLSQEALTGADGELLDAKAEPTDPNALSASVMGEAEDPLGEAAVTEARRRAKPRHRKPERVQAELQGQAEATSPSDPAAPGRADSLPAASGRLVPGEGPDRTSRPVPRSLAPEAQTPIAPTGTRRTGPRGSARGPGQNQLAEAELPTGAVQEATAVPNTGDGAASAAARPDVTPVEPSPSPAPIPPAAPTPEPSGAPQPVTSTDPPSAAPRTTRRSEPSAAEDPAERVRLVQRVARAFEVAQQRGGHVRMRLHPPELGSLRLELTVRHGVMTARVETETESARNMLLENLQGLKDRLAEHQIKVERFEVDWQGQPRGDLSQGLGDQARWHAASGSPGLRGGGRPAVRSDEEATHAVPMRPSPGTQFDVII